MKSVKLLKFAPFLLLTLLNLMALSAYADGGTSGGGGDPIEQDFAIAGNAAINVLDQRSPEVPWLDVHAVRELWDSPKTRIVSTKEELVDDTGRPRAAMNYPSEQLIKVNIEQWNGIRDKQRKNALALHEILGLARIESGHYRVSA